VTVVVWVTPPLLPVMVIVWFPSPALLPTVSVIVEIPAPANIVGLKLTVTPVGWPVADKVMALLKPPEIAVVIVEVPELPLATLIDVGAALMVKLGVVPVTVRETVVVSAVLPEVPITVMLYVPVTVDEPTVIVMVEVPAPVIEVGLKLTVTPVGWPVADKVMAELKPPVAALLIVEPPELPCATETEAGAALMVKLGVVPVTVRETVVVSVVLPEVPVTEMPYVPVTADEATAIVMVEVPAPVIEVGLKLTVTPVGWPVADKVMAELKPPVAALLIVELPELPCATETDAGAALMVKLGVVPVTVRETVVVSLLLPEVPVTVMPYVPVTVDEPTFIVMVEVPAPVIEVGLKLTVTPVGWPVADKAMAELKPPVAALLMVEPPELPCATETEAGAALMVKLGGTVTVRETVVVSLVLPEVPVTVMLYVPVTADEATAIVMVEVPAPVIEVGLKLTVTPVGWPVADKVTVESKPPVTVLLMVELPELPCATETEASEPERLKPGLGGLPASALIRPDPFGLPQPVAKS
jgi:hypothetical protein